MIVLLSLGIYISTRSHQVFSSRLTAIIALCYALGFLGEYFRHILPIEMSLFIIKTVLILNLLGITLSLHTIYHLIENQKIIQLKWAPLIFYIPVTMLTLVSLGYPDFGRVDFYVQGVWVYATFNSLYFISYLSCGVLFIAIVALMVLGYRRSIASSYKNMFRALLIGTGFIGIAFLWLLVISNIDVLPISIKILMLASMSVLLIVGCMVSYDIAPSFVSRYQLMLDLTPVAVVVYDEDLRLKEANALAIQMTPNAQKNFYLYDLFKTVEHKKIMQKMMHHLDQEQRIKDYRMTFFENKANERHFEIDASIIDVGFEKLYYLMIRDVTVNVVQERKNHYLAYHDQLTGLYNRAYFTKFVESNLKTESNMALVLSDLNQFKLINDTYGHVIGDEVLKFTAKLMQMTVGENGVVARLGGDEFIIYFDNIKDETVLQQYLQHLRDAFKYTLFIYEEIAIEVVPSIGYALYPNDSVDYEELLHIADLKMYANKREIKSLQK